MVELVILEHLSFSFVQVPLFLVSSSHLLFFSSNPPSLSSYYSLCVTCSSFFLNNDSFSPSSFSFVCCQVILPPLPLLCLCPKFHHASCFLFPMLQLPPSFSLFLFRTLSPFALHVSCF